MQLTPETDIAPFDPDTLRCRWCGCELIFGPTSPHRDCPWWRAHYPGED